MPKDIKADAIQTPAANAPKVTPITLSNTEWTKIGTGPLSISAADERGAYVAISLGTSAPRWRAVDGSMIGLSKTFISTNSPVFAMTPMANPETIIVTPNDVKP